MSALPPQVWDVYSADHHLVATYSTQAAAAAHVASWPALYYVHESPQVTPVASPAGLSSPIPDVSDVKTATSLKGRPHG